MPNYFNSTLKILHSRFISHTPVWLTHVVTYKCNAKCGMCGRNQQKHDYSQELSITECFKLLDEAKKAGIVSYTMYGGEPLLRQDVPEILQYAHKIGLYVILNTNGYFLSSRYHEIIPYINSLVVSIDAADNTHDKLRGVNNLLDKAIEGIQLCKGKTRISINSVITAQNKHALNGLAQLSNNLDVPIFIQPMVVIKGINEYLALSHEEERLLYQQIKELKNKGYRILNSQTYLDNLLLGKNGHCHAPKIYIRIEGDGSIVFCNNSFWGNVRQRPLSNVFSDPEFINFGKRMETCNLCSSACTDITHLYDNPFYAIKMLKNYL